MPYKPTPANAQWTKLTLPIQPFQAARLEITTTDSQRFYIAEVSIHPKAPGSDEPAVEIVIPYVGKNLWELSDHKVTLSPKTIQQFEKTTTAEGECRYRLHVPQAEIFKDTTPPPQWPRLFSEQILEP
ncbi:hypothetical protein JIN84_09265 [Luteolibacter yonseiensis]|uniref:Uncharacterized protein n=1 Tax=Luteolibacter yonseiensis TaxID=1144680 RepID=A0A934R5F9_9BACT|nr:hypothetical protein [Luteolibacter yonseiensis]MBK1815805.1 hypothetical protein [Luteolibacter yonseiensis]